MPDEAVVCSCNNVTKRAILDHVSDDVETGDHVCENVACVKTCSRAGSTCGSCVPVVKNLIERALRRRSARPSARASASTSR